MGYLYVSNASGEAVTITVASVNNVPLITSSVPLADGQTEALGAVLSSTANFNNFQFNLNANNMAGQLTSYQVNLNHDHWFGDNNATSPAAYPGTESDISISIKGFSGSNVMLGMSYNLASTRPYYASSDSKGMNPA